jgi:hypothetical protein
MRRLTENETCIARLRFHTLGPDNLYLPIPFLFVTERMQRDIETERQLILDVSPSALRARQEKLLARYDPAVCASAFNAVLKVMNFGATS